MHQNERRNLVVVSVAVVCLLASPVVHGDEPASTEWIEGRLVLAWGNTVPGGPQLAPLAATLFLDDGSRLSLQLDVKHLAALGGPIAAQNRRVRVLVTVLAPGSTDVVQPRAIRAVGSRGNDATTVAGSQPWVSLMCKFSNIPSEPEDLSFFENMYANVWPGLDHYWRKQSYGMVDVVGSDAVGWFTLPHPQSHYTDMIVGGNYSPMLGALFDDCTDAAGGSVNLNDFVGINLMFNDTFGSYAWGGGWGGWRVTWEPPWGWGNIAVMGHEMGHGFGLPHSNNADGDGSPYDNPWDVMSDSWGYAMHDGTYGTVGKHTIAFHKNSLGWIPAGQKADVASTGLYQFDIDHLALASTSNLRLVTVQIPGSSRFYTVEVRDRVGYDGNLPGFAVILHEVSFGRSEPAWLVDLEDPGNGGDAGAMWVPGECYDDVDNEISVCVLFPITEGFRVEVGYGDYNAVFRDGFEDGTTGAWTVTAQ